MRTYRLIFLCGVLIATAFGAAQVASATTPAVTRSSTASSPALCQAAAHVDHLVVHRVDALPQNHLYFSFPATVTVTEAESVQDVASALCALPKMPPGIFNCPADFGISYNLTFSAAGQKFAVVSLEPSGCEEVQGLGPTRWIIRNPGFWRVLGNAMGLPGATQSTFAGTLPTTSQLCRASAVRIAASANRTSYGPGQIVVMRSSITNMSSSSCTLWLGEISPTMVVTNNRGVDVWDQCRAHDQPGACNLVLVVHELNPGQSYVRTAHWDQASGTSTTPPVRVPAGTYRFSTHFDGIAGTASVKFVLRAK